MSSRKWNFQAHLEVRSQGVPRAEILNPVWAPSDAFRECFARGRGGQNGQWARGRILGPFGAPERFLILAVFQKSAPRTWPRDPAIFRL